MQSQMQRELGRRTGADQILHLGEFDEWLMVI
jgi:hypothetical protein